ncbi:MAG: hypothetical protein KC478_08290 [Bacteriovoracaceae bacterium]|nr:hypothetical protein [Bacteriovoracaceae bacterium]
MKKLLLLTIFLSQFATAEPGNNVLYEEKIYQLELQGHMNDKEVGQKILKLKLKENSDLEKLKSQARGVANALVHKTVINIDNDPIEVFIP